jgi:hypothetical protein
MAARRGNGVGDRSPATDRGNAALQSAVRSGSKALHPYAGRMGMELYSLRHGNHQCRRGVRRAGASELAEGACVVASTVPLANAEPAAAARHGDDAAGFEAAPADRSTVVARPEGGLPGFRRPPRASSITDLRPDLELRAGSFLGRSAGRDDRRGQHFVETRPMVSRVRLRERS